MARRFIIETGNDNDHLNEKILSELVEVARRSGHNRGSIPVDSAVIIAEERIGEFSPIQNCVRKIV